MARKSGTKTRDYPAHTLEQTLAIINAIVDKGAGQAMDRLLVADAIGRTPGSSEFKRLLSSSRKYGLTTGTEKADYISPTGLGLKIAKPESEEDSTKGLVEACLTPPLFNRIYTKFNRSKLPDKKFFKNTLEKSFDIDPSLSEEVVTLIVKNAETCGILHKISGADYIRMDDPQPSTSDTSTERPTEGGKQQLVDATHTTADPDNTTEKKREEIQTENDGPRQLFVAHGKNRKPLEDLKKILDGFKISYKVAADEPHKGRPISSKVAELMNECSAGVFIFTCDEKLFSKNKDGEMEEVWRPSENVVYELGAASILWDKKIIILKEEGVNFPSDFSDLGYIKFKNDELAHKALQLLQELVGLNLVKVEAA